MIDLQRGKTIGFKIWNEQSDASHMEIADAILHYLQHQLKFVPLFQLKHILPFEMYATSPHRIKFYKQLCR